jgi:formamidopyrimidine-DNA glycosylase
MPELPEVETVVRTLAPHLLGRRIVSALFSSRFVTPGNRKTLAGHLTGRTVQSVQRRGKFIVIGLEEGGFTVDTLTVHLGMTGRLLLDASPGKHTHGIFTLDSGTLIYDDPRQFGRILWNHDLSRLGPEPLEIGIPEFQARMKKRKTSIKALLLNQAFLAGMGNIYVDETLFAARVHPLAMASRLSAPRVAAIHQHMREILSAAIRQGGSSISDYVNAQGDRGWFQLQHQAYGREGEPCPVCGTPIRKTIVAQRGTHYCPRCQRR